MRHIALLDSTLRDGMQGEGITFSLSDKVKIVQTLDALGLPYIEAGNPASNPKDLELFHLLKNTPPKHAKIVAFGSTRRKFTRPKEDEALQALLQAETPVVTLFGKTSPSQVSGILQTTPQENLKMVEESISYLVQHGRQVFFDAEHFFDGYQEDRDYALLVLKKAAAAGAAGLCLCDTNGATYPEDIFLVTQAVRAQFPSLSLGIHCHNDLGLAVAGSMRAVDAGADLVQGTLLGFGERCGNANLCTVLSNLQLKRGMYCIPQENLASLTPTARKIADIANISLPGSLPYVGSSAFAHKGGMHIDAVTKYPSSFEHIPPAIVGNKRKFLVSEMAGKSTLLQKLQHYDPTLKKDSPKTAEIMETLKSLEYRGYQFEAAEESFELVIRRALGLGRQFFQLEYFKIIGEQPLFSRLYPSSAMIKVRVGGEAEITAAEGDGPVHALDLALRKALIRFYPSLGDVRLTDFKVRVLESDATTAATVRVLIESSDGHHTWTTVGVSTDIIEASFLALTDSIEYKLTMDYPASSPSSKDPEA